MKKKMLTCLAIGMSVVMLSGCGILRRAAMNQLMNQPIEASETPSETTLPEITDVDVSGDWTRPNTGTSETLDGGTDDGTGTEIGTTTANPSSGLTASYLSDDAEKAMQSLQSDYNKIAWGVRYSPDDIDGLVISVSAFTDGYGSYFLLIGYTNIFQKDITVSASGYAKGTDGNNIGMIDSYVTALGTGNTFVQRVYCGDNMPNGEIHWDSLEVKEATNKSYVYWEADYAGGMNNSVLTTSYSIQTVEPADIYEVQIVLVDENGYILDYGMDAPQDRNVTQFTGEIKYYGGLTGKSKMDAAVFANPVK